MSLALELSLVLAIAALVGLYAVEEFWSIIQKYYPEPKKRETSGFFVWSKVLLGKGITNRTFGRI